MQARKKVQIWILSGMGDQSKVLLLLTRPERGTIWQPVTGWVEDGEEIRDAALRELHEETGLLLSSEKIQDLDSTIQYKVQKPFYSGLVEESSWVTFTSVTFQPTLDPGEHVEAKWFEWDEARKLLPHSHQVHALQKARTR